MRICKMLISYVRLYHTLYSINYGTYITCEEDKTDDTATVHLHFLQVPSLSPELRLAPKSGGTNDVTISNKANLVNLMTIICR